ncbi:hypothetical protein [Vibrio phage pTD1]|uniref:Uncharacterized protein n=1 Tax=Vibrio phage pTD1 TaxID=1938577 RepID=A0A1Q2U2Z3_9CAUD|nr:hypothetical protein FDH33_gp136 [Vibrio phage pTD1]BAW98345.1 hypothetical protein [Vibrio phage pTD1]
MADFIERRQLTHFTGIDQGPLLHTFFVLAYENVVSWGREQAVELAKGNMLVQVLENLIRLDLVDDFPWLTTEHELKALGVILVEAMDELLVGNTIVNYLPVPNTKVPRGMIVECLREQ